MTQQPEPVDRLSSSSASSGEFEDDLDDCGDYLQDLDWEDDLDDGRGQELTAKDLKQIEMARLRIQEAYDQEIFEGGGANNPSQESGSSKNKRT